MPEYLPWTTEEEQGQLGTCSYGQAGTKSRERFYNTPLAFPWELGKGGELNVKGKRE